MARAHARAHAHAREKQRPKSAQSSLQYHRFINLCYVRTTNVLACRSLVRNFHAGKPLTLLRHPSPHEFMIQNRSASPTPRHPGPDECELSSGAPGPMLPPTGPATPLGTRRKKCLQTSHRNYRSVPPSGSGFLRKAIACGGEHLLRSRPTVPFEFAQLRGHLSPVSRDPGLGELFAALVRLVGDVDNVTASSGELGQAGSRRGRNASA
jgi:hypothetical protein